MTNPGDPDYVEPREWDVDTHGALVQGTAHLVVYDGRAPRSVRKKPIGFQATFPLPKTTKSRNPRKR